MLCVGPKSRYVPWYVPPQLTNTSSPLALEVTSSTIDVEITNTNILIIRAIEYLGITIPFYIYPSLNIPIRVDKLSNEVVRTIYNTGVKANIIYQIYINKYKFNKLPTRITFYRFGHTWEYYEVIKEYVWIYKKKIKDRKSTRLNSSHSQISYAVF